ncbi:MAG TPA: ABC transporter permease [Candidatus Acidoferrum sp.]|nr:ABC transporter permease [Candidatus Acidoferrum sp.]
MTSVTSATARRHAAQHRPLLARLLATEGVPILLVLIVVLVALMALAPNAFLGWRTYVSVMINYQPQIICALGLTLVIASGEIDLSFPSVITLTSLIFAAFYRFDNVFWLNWLAEGMAPEEIKAMQAQLCWLGVVAALGVGAFVGFINGLLVARIGIPSIIATLATAFVWRGLAVFLASGRQFSLRDFNQTDLWAVTTGRLFTGLFSSGVVLRKPDGIPIQAVVVLALAVLLWFILNRHRFGEALLFIGDNANVARVVGIDVKATRVKLFTLMGALAGLAGMFLTMETENFTTTQGQASLLVVIASVFIGGTSIFGGSGTIVGSYVGLLIVVMLQIGMVAMGLGGDVADMVIGVVFILAVILHMLVERPERLKGLGFGNR